MDIETILGSLLKLLDFRTRHKVNKMGLTAEQLNCSGGVLCADYGLMDPKHLHLASLALHVKSSLAFICRAVE